MQILLLEDNKTDADLTRRGLKRKWPDCNIDIACDIGQAGQLLSNNAGYDVALLDIKLPDGLGFEILEVIINKGLDIPVIMLTSSGDEDTAISALKSGASDYVVKNRDYSERLSDAVDFAISGFNRKLRDRNELINVLYIEHHQADIDLTVRHFNQYAPYIRVQIVMSTREALEILCGTEGADNNFHVILMDYRLPEPDTFEFIKALRQVHKISLPLILITGQGNEEIAVQALKLGADNYMSKTGKYLFRLTPIIINAYQNNELRRKQEALQESEHKYRLLAENAGDVIFTMDRDFHFTYASPAVNNLLGYTPDEILSLTASDILTPESLEIARKAVSAIKTDVPLEEAVAENTFELEMIRKDYSVIWTEVKGSLIIDEGRWVSGILCVIRDISERKRTMDEMLKLSRAMEQSPASIVITDNEGIIDYVNPKFTELTGYTLEEAKGKNPRILKSGYTTDEDYKQLWETITKGAEWKGEFRNKRKDGSIYWEQATISPVWNTSGEISYFLAIKEDITEKKKIMQELVSAKERAEESDRLKTAFLHNISHEIRTPLNAIVGFSSLLGIPGLSDEKKNEFIKIVSHSNEQLLSIITGIINLATLEAGQDRVVEKQTDLNELLEDVSRQFHVSSIPAGVTLSYHPALPEGRSCVITDPVKLMQILANLVGNALKFTHNGYVRYGYVVKGEKLHFYVEDTGIGIDPEMQSVIFERFRQIDNSSTRKYGGAGLGLALSRGYVELLGGELSVVSVKGKGSMFSFYIPYKPLGKNCPETDGEPSSAGPGIPSGGTVLVAEDEDNNFRLVEEYLTSAGIRVTRARNGLEAVSMCDGSDIPRIVIMDIKMPVMDGLEATRIIKHKKPALPVIALTAFALESDRKRIMSNGFDGYIEKPVNDKILYSVISKYLL